MDTTTTTTKYNPNVCGTCHRWIPRLAPADVHSPAAFCICHGVTDPDEDAEMLAAIGRDSWDGAETKVVTPAPIPERVKAIQARLEALLDDVKIMGVQLSAWERATAHRDEMYSSDDDLEERPISASARIAEEDAETALLATIEKLEKGTY